MTATVNMGIPGVDEIRPGTHICALYSGPAERDQLLFPFLQEGIREGDKCLCLIDDAEPALVRDQVEQQEGDHPTRSEQPTWIEPLTPTCNLGDSRSGT
jgi:hypothetical protein